MGYLGTQIRDGALYADITPEVLGYPSITPICGIPIAYNEAWEAFGQAFKSYATSTCPVDTGFLRANIDYHADEGGVECWSDADYSAYQEYGTYRMAAQPYFEAALGTALSQTQPMFKSALMYFNQMDGEFSFLLAGCTGGIAECYAYLQRLAYWIDRCGAEGYNTAPLEDAYRDILAHIQQMEQTQMMSSQASGTGLGSFLANLIAIILGTLVAKIFTFPLQQVWEGREVHHTPVH